MSRNDQAKHPLLGLLVAQSLGAFNDNAWKQVVALLAIGSRGERVGGRRSTRRFAQVDPDDPADALLAARRASSPTGSASGR